jgi:hypothetical protein
MMIACGDDEYKMQILLWVLDSYVSLEGAEAVMKTHTMFTMHLVRSSIIPRCECRSMSVSVMSSGLVKGC